MILLPVLAIVLAQPGGPPEFIKQYAPFVTNYYKNPEPDKSIPLLEEFIKPENLSHPFFVQRIDLVPLIAQNLGDIATGKPKLVRAYEARFATATDAGRGVILKVLAVCGDADTQKQLEKWEGEDVYRAVREDVRATRKALADPMRKHVRDRPAAVPHDLDLLWGNFFITGEYAPVARILDVLDLPTNGRTAQLKGVAEWSLKSNLAQHPKLAELTRAHLKDRPEGSRAVLEKLLKDVP